MPSLFLALFVFAALLLGRVSAGAFAWSALAATVSAVLAYRVFYPRFEREHVRLTFPNPALLLLYGFVLARNIFWASFSVARVVLRGHSRPRIVRVRTRLKNPTARLLLALSITLTPGTLTVDMAGPYIYVHWLQAATTHTIRAGDLIKGDMERLLARMFERPRKGAS